MKKPPSKKRLLKSSAERPVEDIQPHYDFAGGARGKYTKRYQAGINLVLLEPEVAAAFPDSAAVNDALRALLAISRCAQKRPQKRP